MAEIDWYDRRAELECGMIFTTDNGVVRLDHQVPGDGTRWRVQDWDGGSWANYESTIEPGDLIGEPMDEASLPRGLPR